MIDGLRIGRRLGRLVVLGHALLEGLDALREVAHQLDEILPRPPNSSITTTTTTIQCQMLNEPIAILRRNALLLLGLPFDLLWKLGLRSGKNKDLTARGTAGLSRFAAIITAGGR